MGRREAKPEFVLIDRWGQVVELITAEAQREGECPAVVEGGASLR